MRTARRAHREGPNARAMVLADLLFCGVEAHTTAHEVAAPATPDGKGELKSYGEDPLVQLSGSGTQRAVGSMELRGGRAAAG